MRKNGGKIEQKSVLISENSRITLGVVALLLMFTFCLAELFWQGNASAKSISDLQSKQDIITAIQIDVGIIKGDVSEMRKKFHVMEGLYDQPGRRNNALRRNH